MLTKSELVKSYRQATRGRRVPMTTDHDSMTEGAARWRP